MDGEHYGAFILGVPVQEESKANWARAAGRTEGRNNGEARAKKCEEKVRQCKSFIRGGTSFS